MAGRPDLRNGRAFIQSNLWVDGPRRYGVWVLPDGGARVGVIADNDGAWQTIDLASVAGNPLALPTEDDLHNVYIIATDADGYVHVMGNMHNDGLRYARSTRPHDVASLEAATIDGATGAITYPQLVALPDGTLLFFRRHGIAGDGHVRLDRLAPGAADWEPVGTILDGHPTGESPYLHDVAVDPETGTIHVLVTWRGRGSEAATNDVSYARSGDGGRTWTTSSGAPLETPITHDSIEMILDTDAEGSGLVNNGGLAVDGNGQPVGALLFRGAEGPRYVVVRLDGRRWQHDTITALGGRPEVVAAGDDVWLLGNSAGAVVAEQLDGDGDNDPDLRPLVRTVPPGWEPVADSNGLADGLLELLMPAGDDQPEIVTMRPEELS